MLIVSTILSLGAAEIALRIIDPPMSRTPELQRWRRPHPTLGWEMIPGLSGAGAYGENIEINSQGLRDVERPIRKQAGTRRILGLGDSFTFGVGVETHETFLKRLEEFTGAEVINAGQIGYGLYQSLEYLKTRGLEYEPDIVIFALFLDDLGGRTIFAAVSETIDRPSTLRLHNLLRNMVSFYGARFRHMQGADWLRDAESRRPHFHPPTAEELVNLRAGLSEMRALSKRLVVVLIPDAAQLDYAPLQTINEAARDVCADLDITFVDMTPIFESVDDHAGLYLFPMDAHTSPRGHAMIAETVAGVL